jgi:hypothetical protein
MADELRQSFPLKEDGRIVHRRWIVDLASAQRIAKWSVRGQKRIHQEVEEMGAHFPRWILTACIGRNRLTCASCGGMLVFDRGLRCVACGRSIAPTRVPKKAELAWFGLLPPVGIDGLNKLKRQLIARPPDGHLVGRREGIGHFLLVPLLAVCPPGFPKIEVRVTYLPSLFKVRGMPRDTTSHAYHMLGGGVMCLFAGREWRRQTTCREVLQQRAYAHVIKLLNYGNGKRNSFAVVS